jgi:glycosyltransferase involved in cell wall biosynthesis
LKSPNYHHIILITDSIPNQNGAGICQTLYNLLDNWPNGCTVLVSNHEVVPTRNNLKASIIKYFDGPWQPIQNRLGKWVNKLLYRRKLEWIQKNGLQDLIWALPSKDEGLVIVCTTHPDKLILAYWLMNKEYRVLPYFMDDWMYGSTLRWKGGSLQKITQKLLQDALGRLVISSQLQGVLEERYQLQSAPTLVVHNPSPQSLTYKFLPSLPKANINLIIYAGSIWPMHADALQSVAKAIHLLQAKGKMGFRLLIYTSQEHWQKNQIEMEGPGIEWGGWIPYEEINKRLIDARWLLCTASFQERFHAFSMTSVQTKLTDYIAAGRPILVVAPRNAACGQWVEDNDCGYWCINNSPEIIANYFLEMEANYEQDEIYINNGQLLAQTRFSKREVQSGLYNFLNKLN